MTACLEQDRAEGNAPRSGAAKGISEPCSRRRAGKRAASDNAGWHTLQNLAVPDGIRLVYLPPYTPEIQPAEHLWPLVDEPIVNQFFDTIDDLDDIVAEQCRALHHTRDLVAQHTHFHWWPKPAKPS